MNKRIRKKKFKLYHKQFCHTSFSYNQGCTKKKYSESYQCPKCGWDSLEADEELKLANILWQTGGFYDYSFEAEYRCPLCNTIFSFIDGN